MALGISPGSVFAINIFAASIFATKTFPSLSRPVSVIGCQSLFKTSHLFSFLNNFNCMLDVLFAEVFEKWFEDQENDVYSRECLCLFFIVVVVIYLRVTSLQNNFNAVLGTEVVWRWVPASSILLLPVYSPFGSQFKTYEAVGDPPRNWHMIPWGKADPKPNVFFWTPFYRRIFILLSVLNNFKKI